MKNIAILLVFMIIPNGFAQKIHSGISYKRAFEQGDGFYNSGQKEIGRHYYLAGSKALLEYIDQDYQLGLGKSSLFQEWIDWQNKLVDIFNEWYNSVSGKNIFFISVLIDPYQEYYLTARPFDCEGESGEICMDYEGIKELALKYGNEEQVDYFDIKIDEPRKGDGYDCEGQSTQFQKPLMVSEKCDKFITKYPNSKYLNEIQDILKIAQENFLRLKNRYEIKKQSESKNSN